MSKYVLLYHGGAQPDPADTAKVMAEWQAWFDQMGEAVVDGGNPFGAGQVITDAKGTTKAAEAGQLTGYSILKADSLAQAEKLAQGCPHLKMGGMVSVYETMAM